MIVNQKELAKILGVTPRWIRELHTETGLFIKTTQGYELEKCVQEYIDYKIKAETVKGASINREREQAEHERIKKQISELKLRKLKRELHEATDVEFYLENMLIHFKNHLLSVPSRVAPILLGIEDVTEILELLQTEMEEVLKELSEYDPEKIDGQKIEEEYEEEN